MQISLGNGGTFINGHTRYNFKPYRGQDVSSDYKQVSVPGIGQCWARIEDHGKPQVMRDSNGVPQVTLPRYTVFILGWGSDAYNGELPLDSKQVTEELIGQLLG